MQINVSTFLHDTDLLMLTVYELGCKISVFHGLSVPLTVPLSVPLSVPLTPIISLVILCNCVYYCPLVVNYVDIFFLHV